MKKITLTGTDGKTFTVDPAEVRYVLAGGIVRVARKMHSVTEESARRAQESICCCNLEDYPAGTHVHTWGSQTVMEKRSDGLFEIKGKKELLTPEQVVEKYGVALVAIAPQKQAVSAQEPQNCDDAIAAINATSNMGDLREAVEKVETFFFSDIPGIVMSDQDWVKFTNAVKDKAATLEE